MVIAFSKVLERLDQSADVPRPTIAKLEVPFVGSLEHYRPNLALHHEITEDPAAFEDLVSWAFEPSDTRTEEQSGDEEDRFARADLAWNLLFHIRRVPGETRDGIVDGNSLALWIAGARRLCRERGRPDIGDQMIGQILANSPDGHDGSWPCEPVRGVLESERSRHIGKGFCMGKINLRGATSRGVFDGGRQERHLADRFRSDAGAISARWPFTAKLLRSLAEEYDHQGRHEDRDADWRDSEFWR